jgi:hypothetical protein
MERFLRKSVSMVLNDPRPALFDETKGAVNFISQQEGGGSIKKQTFHNNNLAISA